MYYETLKGYLLLAVLKSAPGQNSKCFCLKALEIPLRKISISCRRKLLSQQERYTQLDWIQEIFLRWYFISLFGGDGMNEGWIEQNGYTFSALTNVQSFRLDLLDFRMFLTQKICGQRKVISHFLQKTSLHTPTRVSKGKNVMGFFVHIYTNYETV